MPQSSVPVNVNFQTSSTTCAPDPVPVSKANNNGITWTTRQAGYTFTGVQIDGTAAPTGDFGLPAITTTPQQSQMVVSDTGDSVDTDYKYTLLYTDPTGAAQTYDPTIRNER